MIIIQYYQELKLDLSYLVGVIIIEYYQELKIDPLHPSGVNYNSILSRIET